MHTHTEPEGNVSRRGGSEGGRERSGAGSEPVPVNRRAFVGAVGAAVVMGLAGCSEEGLGTPGSPDGSPTGTQGAGTPTEGLEQYSTRAPAYDEVRPEITVEGYEIELFSDFMTINEELGIRTDINAFDAVVLGEEQGFEPGLYVSIGPAIREIVNDSFEEAPRVIYVNADGEAEPYISGEFGVETMAVGEPPMAWGPYPNGVLFTMPHRHAIGMFGPDRGTFEVIAEDVGGPPEESPGPFPLGPAGMAFGPDEQLYVTDYFGKRLLRVSPDGEWENVFEGQLAIPQPTKALVADPEGDFGGDFLVGTFSLDPPESDAVYAVSLDGGGEAEELTGGFTGMEVLSSGNPPEGTEAAPGQDPFWMADIDEPSAMAVLVPTAGPDQPATGVVNVMSTGQPMIQAAQIRNVDAGRVVHDWNGVLGGGSFVTDFTNKGGSGRVWRVTEQ